MENFVRRVQNKIVETFSTNIKTGFNKTTTEEKEDNNLNDNNLNDNNSLDNNVLDNHMNNNNINEMINDENIDNNNVNELKKIEQQQNKNTIIEEDNEKDEPIGSNDEEITRCDYNLNKESNELITDDEIDDKIYLEDKFVTQNDILNLYIEYQKSNKIRDKFFEKVKNDIMKKNKIKHSITMLKIFKNAEENIGEIMHNNRELIINNIMNKDIELNNLIIEGRISKGRNKNKFNDSKFKILSKKYQKLFASHTLLEEEFDELKEKYQRIKNIEFNQSKDLNNQKGDIMDYEFDNNYSESKEDNCRSYDTSEKSNRNINIILKNRGLKNDKKYIKSSLDYQ